MAALTPPPLILVPAKKASTQRREGARIRELKAHFGRYSLAAVTPDIVARYRDDRLAQGKANNTVRLELALLGHLFNVAIKEWHIGLVYNPVANIRKPRPGEGRNRRLSGREQALLLAAVDKHTNPMLGWIVRLAIETGMRQSGIVALRRSPRAVSGQAFNYRGLLPAELLASAIARGTYPNTREAEARLFYTALTRAERYLYVTGAASLPNGKRTNRQPEFAAALQDVELIGAVI